MIIDGGGMMTVEINDAARAVVVVAPCFSRANTTHNILPPPTTPLGQRWA